MRPSGGAGRREHAPETGPVRIPKTWYLTSDGLLHFMRFNNLEDVYTRKYQEVDQVRREYPHLVQIFKSSPFPPEFRKASIASVAMGRAARTLRLRAMGRL